MADTAAELSAQAQAAGIATQWTDVFGKTREVSPETLRALLKALRLPEGAAEAPAALPSMLTCWPGDAAQLPAASGAQPWAEGSAYEIALEHGGTVTGRLASAPGGGLQTALLETGQVPPGYHRLEIAGAGRAATLAATLAVAPRRCFSVSDAVADSGRHGSHGFARTDPPACKPWGLAAQLYSLRRPQGWGVGDFTALEMLAQSGAAHGASALAISPVHAMFSADPGRFSPYGPSSRLFLNVLHIDPAGVLGEDALAQALRELPGSEAAAARLDARPLIDWPAAARLKLAVLRQLFAVFRRGHHAQTAFEDFCKAGGQALEDHARYEALDAWLRRQQGPANQGDWRKWPAAYRDPRAATVQAFAGTHAENVAFHRFLQWQAALGLQGAQAAARDGGMAIGIIADLAVGADPGGSQAWGLQAGMLQGLNVGAPPDLLAPQGQDWGLGALSPSTMRAQGFAPWLDMLRANMRAVGGIRIDHVLGLMRLWLVPQGRPSSEGAYLHYPLDDMLRLTALESVRHRAIVIGEDLGTVPAGFSDKLAGMGVLGIRALWFQREYAQHGQPFMPASAWPADAMATTSTHDLATLQGWWTGRDIDWRQRLGLLADDDAALQRTARAADRQALARAVQDDDARGENAGPDSANVDAGADGAPLDDTIAFVGKTPAALVMVPLEDVLGMAEQPNLPGTTDVHPNWQQRLRENAGTLLDGPAASRRLAVLDAARQMSANTFAPKDNT